jgi:hypothetical protein
MYGAVPAREVQRSDQVSDVSKQAEDADLLVNNLSYHQPEALSLVVARQYNRQFFQRSSYSPGETAVIDFNAGTDFTDPGNSYLTFKVGLTGTDPVGNFGHASAMNCIKQVTIKSRSGTELDRIERANLWSYWYTRYTESAAYLGRQGPAEGFPAFSNIDKPVGTTVNDIPANLEATARRFFIPLKRLAPFFNPVRKGQKIPPQLMSGLHMEIVWESAAVALFTFSGTVTSYAISELAIMTDSACMTDDVQRTINEQSASDGLEYVYPRIWTDTYAASGTQINAQIRKAVSQATIAWSIPMASADQVITADSMSAIAWGCTKFQYRLGALYFPQQYIQDDSKDGVEAYAQALETFDKLKHMHNESSVSLGNFVLGAAGTADYRGGPGGLGCMAVSLEKDTALNLSGLPVNNSRVLELNATLATAADREVVTFLEYLSVARSYVDNTAVSI